MDAQTTDGFSTNLILLLMIEMVISLIILYYTFFVKTFISGSVKNFILIFLFLTMLLGYFILQIPDSTDNDNYMFTIDLVIIPFLVFVCILGKMLFSRTSTINSSSIMSNKPKPTADESTILEAPVATYKGGARKHKRSRRFRT